jgi:hypothetical protein
MSVSRAIGTATYATCFSRYDELELRMNSSDTTPHPTRAMLVAVLTITAIALCIPWPGSIHLAQEAAAIAPILWLYTGLFALRVVGQVLVAIRPRKWLPPMSQWNLIPYPILLPIQIVFIVVMVWINMAFTSAIGIALVKSASFGKFLMLFSAVYALVMAIRYVIRMHRKPDQRWFGGTIPIVFHFVLASYLYTLGLFYAGR